MKNWLAGVIANWIVTFRPENFLTPIASEVFGSLGGGKERRIYIFGVRVASWQLYRV